MKQKFKTIVIDGDYLAYLCAFPTQSDRYCIKDQEDNLIISYPTLKSCETYLTKNGIDIANCIVTKEKTVHKNWEYIARKIAISKVEQWKKDVGATSSIIALGETNFRDRLNLLYNKYKDRDSSKKPIMLPQIRQLIKDLYRTQSIPDLEADDIISMYQYLRS